MKQFTKCSIAFLICALLICLPVIPAAQAAETVAQGSCGDSVTWVLDDAGVLTITGTGEMDDYDVEETPAPWYSQRDAIVKVVIDSGVTNVGEAAFTNCANLQTVTLPDSVTWLGAAFAGCTSLENINIPSGVSMIPSYGFQDCTSLKSIVIPEGVLTINFFAFAGCTSLESITLPASILEIYEFAFIDTVLKDVYYQGSEEQWQNVGAYDWTLEEVTIHFAAPSVDQGECGENLLWVLNKDGVLTISGTGAMDNFAADDQPWYSLCDAITAVVVEGGVTTVGKNAFQDCYMLERVSLPEGLTGIGKNAFAGTALTSVRVPGGTQTIGEMAFFGCTDLSALILPESLTAVEPLAFDSCSGLTDVFYMGTQSQWNAISIQSNNDALLSATRHDSVTETVQDDQRVLYCPGCDAYYTLDGEPTAGAPAVVTISGTITSFLEEATEVTIELRNSQGVLVRTVTVSGNSAEYNVDNVTADTYTMKVSKANHAARTYTVTVRAADVTQDVTIRPMGDATGDGKVTAADYSCLLAHVRKTDTITDEYTLQCADVIRDGNITATDYSRLLAHVKKVSPMW